MAWKFVAVGKRLKLFFNVTADHSKTTGKLRYFISNFEKHIQTQWIYIFSACLSKAFLAANWGDSVSSGAKENWYAFLEVIDYLILCLETSWKKMWLHINVLICSDEGMNLHGTLNASVTSCRTAEIVLCTGTLRVLFWGTVLHNLPT